MPRIESVLRRAGLLARSSTLLATSALLLGVMLVAADAGAVSFDATFTAVPTPGWSFALDVGDVNGDGSPDLVTSMEASRFEIFLGTGDGAFQQVAFVPTAQFPQCMQLGDVDGDGDLDVVTGSGQGHRWMSVALGQGDGTFGPRVDYPTGRTSTSFIREMALADFDGDGSLDAVFTDDSTSLSLFVGNGDGTFAPMTIVVTARASHVAAADVTEDGAVDLILSHPGNAAVLRGHGDGTFDPPLLSTTPTYACAIADLNGDGHLDIAGVSTPNPNAPSFVAVSLGAGDGTFGTPSLQQVGKNPRDLSLGDLDGDGWLDVVAVNLPSNIAGSISVLRNAGNGTLETQRMYPTPVYPRDGAVGDFDGDGILDVAVATRVPQRTAIYRGNGDATFGRARSFAVGENPNRPAAGDLDGDGDLDLVVGQGYPETFRILLGDGAGGAVPGTPLATGESYGDAALGDLNSDGRQDLVAPGPEDSTVSVWLGNGDGTFGARSAYTSGLGTSFLEIVDADGDGNLDIATPNRYGVAFTPGTTVSVLLGNGDGTFQPRLTSATGNGPLAFDVADFNLDGIPDLAVELTQTSSISILLGIGDGTFSTLTHATGDWYSGLAAGDLNGDGRPDLATFEVAATVYFGVGDGTFSPGPSSESMGAHVSGIADFDLDGHLDLVLLYGTGVDVMRGDGAGSFVSSHPFEYGFVGWGPVIADFDDDGWPDLVSAVDETGELTVLLNSTPGLVSAPPSRRLDPSRVAITGVSPNPSRGDLEIAFVLSVRAPAVLELFDLAGRRQRRMELGSLEPGAHRVRLVSGPRLASGIYFARLSQAGAASSRRAVFVD